MVAQSLRDVPDDEDVSDTEDPDLLVRIRPLSPETRRTDVCFAQLFDREDVPFKFIRHLKTPGIAVIFPPCIRFRGPNSRCVTKRVVAHPDSFTDSIRGSII